MILNAQYQWVTSSRKALLNYCDTISPGHFIMDNSDFGRGSIRNLLVHIANTYEFWLAKHALKKSGPIRTYDSVTNVGEARAYFETIDMLVDNFFIVYADLWNNELELALDSRQIRVSPLQLFTHVITHEFHHKGQILSLSRHLGYLPIDTDIIR